VFLKETKGKGMTSRSWAKTFSLCDKPRGAVSRNKVVEKIELYSRETKKALGLVEKHRLLTIGHQAGDFERYPKDPGKISMDTVDILELMKNSFEDYCLDGIEIDIQIDHKNIIDENLKDVYVVHNELETQLAPFAIDYFKRNTLRKVIRGFVDSKYHERGKHIYIEIKCNDSERLNNRDNEAISGALDIIDDVVKGFSASETQKIFRHIGFASFNHRALERIAGSAKGRHNLFFIVASNRALGWIATKTIYPHFNFLGKRLKKVLLRSEFLTGVWFDPCAVKDFSEIFNAMNREREGNPLLRPLDVYVSTYLLEEREYFRKLGMQKDKMHHVEGLFFEIKR
jgi:hypothetical protein